MEIMLFIHLNYIICFEVGFSRLFHRFYLSKVNAIETPFE